MSQIPTINLSSSAGRQRIPYPEEISDLKADQEYINAQWGRGPVFTPAPNLYVQGKQPVIRTNLKDPRYAQQWAENKGYTAYSQNDWDGDQINDVVVVGKDGIQAFNGYTTAKSQWGIDQGYYNLPRKARKETSKRLYKNKDSARDVFLKAFVKPVWTAFYEQNPDAPKLNYIEFSALVYKHLVLRVVSERLSVDVVKGSIEDKIQAKIRNNKSVKNALSYIVGKLINIDKQNGGVISQWIADAIISRLTGKPLDFSTIDPLLGGVFNPPLVTNAEIDDFAARFSTEHDVVVFNDYRGMPASPQKYESPTRTYGQALQDSPF